MYHFEFATKDKRLTALERMEPIANLTPKILGYLHRYFLETASQEEKDEIDNWMHECYANDFYFDLLLDYSGFRCIEYLADLIEKAEKCQQPKSDFQPLAFETIFNNAPDLIGVHDENGIFKQVSASSSKIVGYPPEDLIGKHILFRAFEEEFEDLVSYYYEIVENDSIAFPQFVYQIVLPDDSRRWLESTFSSIPQGQSTTDQVFISITRVVDDKVIRQLNYNSQIRSIGEEIYWLIRNEALTGNLQNELDKLSSDLNIDLDILITPWRRKFQN